MPIGITITVGIGFIMDKQYQSVPPIAQVIAIDHTIAVEIGGMRCKHIHQYTAILCVVNNISGRIAS